MRPANPDKTEVWQGTLALMILKTLETMGELHGYGLARRIDRDLVAVAAGDPADIEAVLKLL